MTNRVLAMCLVVGCGDDGMGSGSASSTTDEPSTQTTVGASESSTSSDSDASSSSGDESSSTGAPLPEVDFETDIQPLFNNCTCHLQGASGMMTAPFMTLNPGVSHGEIVGVPSMQSDLDRVAPNDLEASYLWHKVNGTHLDVGGSGTSMPPGAPLSEESLLLLRAWILQGAKP